MMPPATTEVSIAHQQQRVTSPLGGTMRRLAIMLGVLGLVSSTAGVIGASSAFASGSRLFVAPGAAANGRDTSCATAKYSSIQSAVNAASSGGKVVICAGTYNEQVTVGTSDVTLEASGAAVIQPASAVANASDEDTSQPILAIVAVSPGATNVKLYGLTVDGSALASSVNSCSDEVVGVLYQASSGHAVSGLVSGLKVENVTPAPADAGCGNGLAVVVQAGPSGTATASVKLVGNTVTGYDKNGITCADVGTVCKIVRNTITTSPTSALAQNGVQVGFGAEGTLAENTISGNDWTAYPTDTANPQVQSDFGAGVLLYGAGINTAGATSSETSVNDNTLDNNQIGVEVVDSAAVVSKNAINESSPGLADSIGVYGVGCDGYCGYFNADNGHSLTSTASSDQSVVVRLNSVNFAGAPPRTYGIWLGDDGWTATGSYYPPAGSEKVTVSRNTVTGATHPLLIDAGAST
jgi:hypothetical protein